jgi:hypothetical protein
MATSSRCWTPDEKKVALVDGIAADDDEGLASAMAVPAIAAVNAPRVRDWIRSIWIAEVCNVGKSR